MQQITDSLGSAPPIWKLALAFATVYLVWGSTYLAIRLAVDTLPPLFMAGTRFVIAGGLLLVWSLGRGRTRLTWPHLRSILLIAAALLVGGAGAVSVSEQWVASGIAALLIATEPLFVAAFQTMLPGGERPNLRVALGLALGLLGVALLVPGGGSASTSYPLGIAMILGASVSWAAGSLYASRAPLPDSPVFVTGSEMLAGGAMLLLLSGLLGEWRGLDLSRVSTTSWFALAYLVVLGSLVGFSAYSWLLRVARPSAVATYAFVNPMIAVLLGWAVAGEAMNAGILVGGLAVVGAVILITLRRRSAPKAADSQTPTRAAESLSRTRGLPCPAPCQEGRSA